MFIQTTLECSYTCLQGFKCDSERCKARYSVQGTTLTDSVVVASSEIDQEDMMKLWHMSERGMQILAKGGLLCGNKIKDLGFYEHCVFGKLHRSKIPKAIHITKGS